MAFGFVCCDGARSLYEIFIPGCLWLTLTGTTFGSPTTLLWKLFTSIWNRKRSLDLYIPCVGNTLLVDLSVFTPSMVRVHCEGSLQSQGILFLQGLLTVFDSNLHMCLCFKTVCHLLQYAWYVEQVSVFVKVGTGAKCIGPISHFIRKICLILGLYTPCQVICRPLCSSIHWTTCIFVGFSSLQSKEWFLLHWSILLWQSVRCMHRRT